MLLETAYCVRLTCLEIPCVLETLTLFNLGIFRLGDYLTDKNITVGSSELLHLS